jgi:hypothetical protein
MTAPKEPSAGLKDNKHRLQTLYQRLIPCFKPGTTTPVRRTSADLKNKKQCKAQIPSVCTSSTTPYTLLLMTST